MILGLIAGAKIAVTVLKLIAGVGFLLGQSRAALD
jgi:hypothetical protein